MAHHMHLGREADDSGWSFPSLGRFVPQFSRGDLRPTNYAANFVVATIKQKNYDWIANVRDQYGVAVNELADQTILRVSRARSGPDP